MKPIKYYYIPIFDLRGARPASVVMKLREGSSLLKLVQKGEESIALLPPFCSHCEVNPW